MVMPSLKSNILVLKKGSENSPTSERIANFEVAPRY